jgi:hypothetical protein
MGYDIYVVARSMKLKQKMLRFMRKNHVTWEKLVGCEHRYTSDILHGHQLCAGKFAIGIHYGVVSGVERDYAYAVVRWMSLKIGRRCKTFGGCEADKSISEKPVPYYSYDGTERCPIVTEGKSIKGWRIVDKYGLLKRPYDPMTRLAGMQHIKFDKMRSYTDKKDGKKYMIFPIAASECKKYKLPKGSHMGTPQAQKLFEKFGRETVRKERKLIRDEMKRLDALWNELP